MAITVTALTAEGFTNNTQTQDTSYSLTPVAGRHYVAIALQSRGSTLSGSSAVVTHLGGTPLALTAISGFETLSQNGTNTSGAKLVAFQGLAGGSETGGAIRSDSGTATLTEGHVIALLEITSADTSTPFPQAGGTQFNNNATAARDYNLAGGLAGADSVVVACLACHVISTDVTIPTGFTSLVNVTSTAPNRLLRIAYAVNDGTADWTGLDTGGTGDYILASFEIKAAAAGSDVLIQGLQAIDRGMLAQTAVRLGGLLQ